MNLAAVIPGRSFSDPPTSVVCRTGDAGFHISQTYADKLSRVQALGYAGPFDLIAIGGPVLPPNELNYDKRSCERVIRWGPFLVRCGHHHPSDERQGRLFRRAGCDTAFQWKEAALGLLPTPYPQIQQPSGLMEVVPNAFMSVMIPDHLFDSELAGRVRVGSLHQACTSQGLWKALESATRWNDAALWRSIATHEGHDERSALICLVAATCVCSGTYVALGDPVGGYFFLPPWPLWQRWSRNGLDRLRGSHRLERDLEVWIDGRRHSASEPLPDVP